MAGSQQLSLRQLCECVEEKNVWEYQRVSFRSQKRKPNTSVAVLCILSVLILVDLYCAF